MATSKLAKKVTRKTAKKAAKKVVKKVAKKAVKKAVNDVAEVPHDAPFEKAIQDLWSAIRISPIDFIDKVTGKPFTRARFASIKSGRTIKDIEKFTKHVKKLTKSLAAFVESGGDLKTIRDDVKRLGQPAPRKTAKKSAR
jgi:predicted ArsR family transcriptional regulator